MRWCDGRGQLGIKMGAREIRLFELRGKFQGPTHLVTHPNCPDGVPGTSAGPNRFKQTQRSHLPVAYDPYKPQIQIQLFFLSFQAT